MFEAALGSIIGHYFIIPNAVRAHPDKLKPTSSIYPALNQSKRGPSSGGGGGGGGVLTRDHCYDKISKPTRVNNGATLQRLNRSQISVCMLIIVT